ncbi:NAD(P)/FAD-dependent oxidoreductase [Geodermatophilus sp. DSM 44513]|uniref:dihydrolipoyl dehydrogenase family protein n=1 Tax=Geodermatophilus sp. DSM 44513 TaxID=1528104 RepID=UPI00126BEA6D|nr:NAD(P)/FAD-dependent oxidoreductase [Geodermatophilus sp. DSM 44513]WNV73959.1 NAD(P)/FAD-dependent oxidoreductase [Geodermatophilus sp. DSM 44513]
MDTYDVVVLGAGPAGENVAARVVRGGLTAVVVEAELVGGECSYWACMPSKALLRPVHALRAARRLPGAREAVTGDLDVAAVLARRDAFAGHHDDAGQVRWLTDVGVHLVRGHGRLAGERRVEVTRPDGTPTTLAARHAVAVATGSTAALPPVPGLAEARPWTSRGLTTARDAPSRLLVLGAGVVGLEMAQAWAGLGSSVTVLEVAGRLLPAVEPFAGELLAGALREDGVDLRLGVRADRVARPCADGPVTVHLADGAAVEADELAVAAGRRPATTDLGLQTLGLRPGDALPVDDTLRVEGSDWLYAVGDVNGRALLTHQGKYQARVAGDAIAARARGEQPGWRAEADDAAVPQVVFTDPEVAAVGLTTAQAAERGLRTRTVTVELGHLAGAALHARHYRGRAALVLDEDRAVVVGATFVGQDVAELVHAATVAVVGRVPLDRLRHAVPPFPTIGEAWLRLLEEAGL